MPNADNTGVPKGTKLTVHDGDMTITTPNEVIDGLDIHGFVSVKAPGVVIENSIVRGGDTTYDRALVDISDTGGVVTIRDSELVPTTPSYHVRGVFSRNATSLLRVNIHGVIDQVLVLSDNLTVRDSWLHDNLVLAHDPNQGNTPSHSDNIQVAIGTNLTIVHNTLTGGNNASLMVTQDSGHVADVTFTDNYADGGACSINLVEKAWGPMHGFVISNNVFGRDTTLADCAIISPPTTTALLSLSNNVYTDGTPVVVRRGG